MKINVASIKIAMGGSIKHHNLTFLPPHKKTHVLAKDYGELWGGGRLHNREALRAMLVWFGGAPPSKF